MQKKSQPLVLEKTLLAERLAKDIEKIYRELVIIGRETPQRVTKSGPKDWQPSTCQTSLRKTWGSHLLGSWRRSWKMEHWWLLMVPWNERKYQNTSSKSIFSSWFPSSKWWTYPKWQSSSGLPFRKPQPGDCPRHHLHNWRNWLQFGQRCSILIHTSWSIWLESHPTTWKSENPHPSHPSSAW